MSNVLIIDDQSTSRIILEELVSTVDDDITVRTFDNPLTALEWAQSNPTDLILTDYKMPAMDGVEFTRQLRKLPGCADIPVIIITVVDDKVVRYQALESGATDILTKPVDHHECRARCRNLLTLRKQQQIIKNRAKWLEKQVAEATRLVHRREQETLLRLARAAELREGNVTEQGLRIGLVARLIATRLGLSQDECEVIEIAATLHDIGNVGVPDAILMKPGRLAPEEFESVKLHTTLGHSLLKESQSPYLQMGAVIALNHHERFDGRGYPKGISGEQIPLVARIAAVADVYDALTSHRPYRPAWSMDQALTHLNRLKGLAFDPRCIEAFHAQFSKVATLQTHNQLFQDVD